MKTINFIQEELESIKHLIENEIEILNDDEFENFYAMQMMKLLLKKLETKKEYIKNEKFDIIDLDLRDKE